MPAPPIDAIYGNPAFYGSMYTAGSATVIGYFKTCASSAPRSAWCCSIMRRATGVCRSAN